MKPHDFEQKDGRRRRSLASRDRIIDAVLAMIDDDTPLSAENVAARAGVGLRSVFRHFGDMDSLHTAVLDRVAQRFQPMLAPYRPGPWPDQVREALARRMLVFESALKYLRIAQMHRAGFDGTLARRRRIDGTLRARLEAVVPETVRADAIWFEQLVLWCSLDCYAALREHSALSQPLAVQVIAAAVDALLAGHAE